MEEDKKITLIGLAKIFADFIDVQDREDYINNLNTFMKSYINILAKKTETFKKANVEEYEENIDVVLEDGNLSITIPEQVGVLGGKTIPEQNITTIFGDIEEYTNEYVTDQRFSKEAFYLDCAKIASEASKQFISLDRALQMENHSNLTRIVSASKTLSKVEEALINGNSISDIDALDYHDPEAEKAAISFAYTTLIRAANAEGNKTVKENIKKILGEEFTKDYFDVDLDERNNIIEAEYTVVEMDGQKVEVPTMDIIVAQDVNRVRLLNEEHARNNEPLEQNVVQNNEVLQYMFNKENGDRLSLYEVVQNINAAIERNENDGRRTVSRPVEEKRLIGLLQTVGIRVLKDYDANKEIALCRKYLGDEVTLEALERIQDAKIITNSNNTGIIEAKKYFVDNQDNAQKLSKVIGETTYEELSSKIVEDTKEKNTAQAKGIEAIKEILAPIVDEMKRSNDLKEKQLDDTYSDEEKDEENKELDEYEKDKKSAKRVNIFINLKNIDKSDHSVKNVSKSKNVDKSVHTTNNNYAGESERETESNDDEKRDKEKREKDDDTKTKGDDGEKGKDGRDGNDGEDGKNYKEQDDDDEPTHSTSNNPQNEPTYKAPIQEPFIEPVTPYIEVETPSEDEKNVPRDNNDNIEDTKENNENKSEPTENLVQDGGTIIINGNPVINNGTIIEDNSINNVNVKAENTLAKEDIDIDMSNNTINVNNTQNNVQVNNTNVDVKNTTLQLIGRYIPVKEGSEVIDYIWVDKDDNVINEENLSDEQKKLFETEKQLLLNGPNKKEIEQDEVQENMDPVFELEKMLSELSKSYKDKKMEEYDAQRISQIENAETNIAEQLEKGLITQDEAKRLQEEVLDKANEEMGKKMDAVEEKLKVIYKRTLERSPEELEKLNKHAKERIREYEENKNKIDSFTTGQTAQKLREVEEEKEAQQKGEVKNGKDI